MLALRFVEDSRTCPSVSEMRIPQIEPGIAELRLGELTSLPDKTLTISFRLSTLPMCYQGLRRKNHYAGTKSKGQSK